MSDFQKRMLAVAIAVPLVLIQATWIFRDARKRGESHYWLWGLFGLVNVPESVIVYLIVTRTRGKKCHKCGKNISKSSSVCPYCGEKTGKVCPNCKESIEEDWDYCPKCSKNLRGNKNGR